MRPRWPDLSSQNMLSIVPTEAVRPIPAIHAGICRILRDNDTGFEMAESPPPSRQGALSGTGRKRENAMAEREVAGPDDENDVTVQRCIGSWHRLEIDDPRAHLDLT